jgi:branched-chain amino acid transport system permease protein
VISFTFGLGSALAGAGGVLYAMNYPSIDPLMGVMPGLKAFVAAILGGIGNIPGAALGGLILGTVETFVNGSQWSTYKDAIDTAYRAVSRVHFDGMQYRTDIGQKALASSGR